MLPEDQRELSFKIEKKGNINNQPLIKSSNQQTQNTMNGPFHQQSVQKSDEQGQGQKANDDISNKNSQMTDEQKQNISQHKKRNQLINDQVSDGSQEKSDLRNQEVNINPFQQIQQVFNSQGQQNNIQNGNLNKVTLDFRKNEASEQQLEEIKSVIQSQSGKENVQVIVQAPQQNLYQKLQEINQQHPDEFQFFQPVQNHSQSRIYYQPNHQNQEKTIKITSQIENNLPKEMKAIIFDWKCIQSFKEQAQTNDVDIDLDINYFQYTLTGNYRTNQSILDQLHDQFEQKFQSFIILTHYCQSQEEATSKLQLLSKKEIIQVLKNKFNVVLPNGPLGVDILQNYPPFQIRKCLRDIGKQYIKENILIVILEDYDVESNSTNIKELQQRFDEIIEKLIMHYQDESQIIYVDNLIDLEDIKLQILQIDTDNINIQILNPNYDNYQSRHYYTIIYNIWMLRQDQNKIINQSLADLKHKIENLVNPIMELKIEMPEQIQIWFLYLQYQYNLKEIRVDKTDKYILLKFVVDLQTNQNNKKEILKKLRELEYSQFTFVIDQKIIEVLKKYPDKQNLFENKLSQIAVAQKIAYLQIIQVDDLKQQIVIDGVYSGHSKGFINIQLQQNLIDLILIKQVDFNFNDIFKFQQKSKESYELEYRCYIGININQSAFVTFQENVQAIEKSIQEFKDSLNMKIIIVRRQLQNTLLMEKVEQIINNDHSIDQKINISYNQNTIEFRGPEHIMDEHVKKLDDIIQNESKKQRTLKIQINAKIWKYINEKEKQKLLDFQKQNKCLFDSQGLQGTNGISNDVAILEFIGKVLTIRQGDITKKNCDAIVNSCNDQMNFGNMNLLNGVAAKILEFGGPTFRKYTDDLIKRQGKLKEADLYKVPNCTSIKYIISVPTIYYSEADKNIEQFRLHIQQIFDLAKKNFLISLVIPILGGGAAGYFFKTVSNIIINEVIVLMQKSKIVRNVVIIEDQQFKADILVNILKDIIYPPKIRQIKYQWKWEDDDGWKDYDDIEINQQIDEAYENYLKNINLNELKITFPCTKLPGTHRVDLKKMRVTDIKTKERYKLSENKSAKNQTYSLDGVPLDGGLSEFIEMQKLSGKLQFKIFLKSYIVKFQSTRHVFQYNTKTKFEREITVVPYTKCQVMESKCPINSQFQFQELQISQSQTQTNSLDHIDLIVQSYDDNLNEAKSFIDKVIKQVTMTIKWQVCNMNDFQGIEVNEFINKKSINYQGQVRHGNEIEIFCLISKAKKIKDYLETAQLNQMYPSAWTFQNDNMIKVPLSTYDAEFNQVSKLFLQSYQKGKIYQIYRIQNKLLYENFHDEKKKLIKSKSKEQQLKQVELEKYLWHGVKYNNPQVIYEKEKEAFDCTYCSDNNMWGRGIYFAENSVYSKDYSYKLPDGQYQGKLVFLLCQVATGKVIKQDANSSLLRPPDGYDCVQGYTGGSDIYVLYGMDVRRAYPAYEVIFK